MRLTAQAKGAGMISPAFATMLCFVQTDAALAPETADLLLGVCVKRSFDRISVDGQLSTNDTAILMASGASGVRVAPESEDEVRFGEALDYLLRRLAMLIVRDGEGAKRVGRVVVHGGHEPHVTAAARAVADSPLVKAALHGGDPNWGRIAQAVGQAVHDSAPLPVDIWIEDTQVCAKGAARALRRARARRRGRGGGGRVHGRPARRGRRGRGVLLRPLARVRDDQRGVHDMTAPARDITTLLEALPYIREFHGRTVVIKYGGAAMTDPALREDFARDVVLLKYVGLNPIVVHGGGPDITAYMQRLDMPVEFVGGLRVSDEDTVEIAKMVLVGKVNKDIVMRLNRHGQPAVGLSGDDGQLFRVSTMEGPGGEDIGLVGKIERVDATVIHHIAEDYIPVIASVGADRLGPLAQRQRRRGRGRRRARHRRLQGHVPHGRRGLAARPGRPGLDRERVRRRRGRGRAGGHLGRDAAEAAGLHRRDPRRRLVRAHHRRPPAALAAAGAVHRRRRRHEDPAGVVSALAPTYARYPVEFASGSGCVLVDSDGVEYLDFLAGIAVCSLGHSTRRSCAPCRSRRRG